MTLKKLCELGYEKLPYASNYKHDIIRVAIKKGLDIDLESQLDAPTIYDAPSYILEYQKMIINGSVIGWEFVGIVNGI